MTNREWYLNKLNAMTNEELANYVENETMPWCSDNCLKNCAQCAKAWFDKEHVEQMPEIENGMFVKVWLDYLKDSYIGVITTNKGCEQVIVYNEGTWDFVKNVHNNITAVYDANCFACCDDKTCIWRKDEN